MQKPTPASLSEVFPHVDITQGAANVLLLPLQNTEISQDLHMASHKNSILFAVGHSAVSRAAHEALAEDSQAEALLIGCEIFELISSALRLTGYSSENARAVVYESARRFVDPINIAEFAERAEYASRVMQSDAPILHDTVSEIAAKRLAHNEASLAYAIAGAGIMRGMQVRTDRQLAS